jgi:nucleoid DNA-binding protein
MAKNKTIETRESVAGFLATIKDEKRRKDCSAIIDLITEQTGLEPKMWGTSIVGFGSYHYKYESGREGDAPLTGLASRANAITLYLVSDFEGREELLSKFGKYKTDKGCVYIQRLEEIDTSILIKMVKKSIQYYQKKYPGSSR